MKNMATLIQNVGMLQMMIVATIAVDQDIMQGIAGGVENSVEL